MTLSFLFVGKNLSNKCRRSAKGYVIRRDGRRVSYEYGSVIFDNSGPVARARLRWKVLSRPHLSTSLALAKKWVKALIQRRKDRGYKRAGVNILPREHKLA